MPHRINLAILCLHISAALYLVVGILFGVLFHDDEDLGALAMPFAIGAMVFCVLLTAGIEVVVWGLRRRKFWAWVAGLCIFGIYIPSLFLPLGALGLWGLLDAGSRRAFGLGQGDVGFEPVLPPTTPR